MTARLLLDEMYSPAVARALGKLGHDVISVAADPRLRGMADAELYVLAGQEGRWIVTENVRDFRPLLLRAEESGQSVTPLLFTSSRGFPRSRSNPGPLVAALDSWLGRHPTGAAQTEDWLI